MSILEVKDVVKIFKTKGGDVRALNGVSLNIEEGKTVGVVGESGSGKTTLGRLIVGLINPNRGSISFEQRSIGSNVNIRHPEIRGKIQLVFQEPSESLDPRIKIGDSICEPLKSLKISKSDWFSKLKKVADKVSLNEDQLSLYPSQLSAGQQQRAGIARALITDPKLIVLDEPTSALDPTARAEILAMLQDVQKEFGVSYIYISHDLSTVRYLTDETAVMYLGEIVEFGETNKIFSRPSHPYSTGLLSSILLPDPEIVMDEALELSGEIPSPINLPTGCFLGSRCPLATDECKTKHPDLLSSGDRMVRCFEVDKMKDIVQPSSKFEDFDKSFDQFMTERLNASKQMDLN